MSNTQQYREVQRKANVGERIKIVESDDSRYDNGDEFVVDDTRDAGVFVKHPRGHNYGRACVFHSEYVVLEPIAPAAPLTASLPDLFAQFIRDNAPAVRSYLAELEPVDSAEPVVEASAPEPQLTRAKVIELARERVAELLRIGSDRDSELVESPEFSGTFYAIEFFINRDKRAVTALVYPTDSGGSRIYRRPAAVGIAKCAPDDVFNADIGKAIAAERALGLTLTDAFVNAPKPADDALAPGTIVYLNEGKYEYELGERRPEKDGACDVGFAYWLNERDGWDGTNNFTKLDDTIANYAQEAGEAA